MIYLRTPWSRLTALRWPQGTYESHKHLSIDKDATLGPAHTMAALSDYAANKVAGRAPGPGAYDAPSYNGPGTGAPEFSFGTSVRPPLNPNNMIVRVKCQACVEAEDRRKVEGKPIMFGFCPSWSARTHPLIPHPQLLPQSVLAIRLSSSSFAPSVLTCGRLVRVLSDRSTMETPAPNHYGVDCPDGVPAGNDRYESKHFTICTGWGENPDKQFITKLHQGSQMKPDTPGPVSRQPGMPTARCRCRRRRACAHSKLPVRTETVSSPRCCARCTRLSTQR